MKLKLRASTVYEKNWRASTRFVVNQGGSRSTKTYSINQALITHAYDKPGRIFTIARKTLQALRPTAMRDFFDILKEYSIYNDACHNMTENTYELNGNLFQFIGMDQPQKKRGAKHDFLWMNETNEFTLEDFRQLNMRTTKQVFFDFNPSEDFWIDQEVLNRGEDKVTFIESTYKNNGFLTDEQIEEIEYLREVDPAFWTVFGLGQKAKIQGQVYTNTVQAAWPERCQTICYGLDFGFTKPSALTEYGVHEEKIYERELLYETQLLNNELIDRMKDLVPNRKIPIYADSASPDKIREIYLAGFNIHGAEKAWVEGVDMVNRVKLHMDPKSTNLIAETKTHKRQQDKNGDFIDAPVKFRDHLMDARRYAIYSHALKYGQQVFGIMGLVKAKSSGGRRERRRRGGSDDLDGF